MNTLNLTTLQEKLPQIVDNMLKTGIPVEIKYHGSKAMIVAVKSTESVSVTERLKAQPLLTHQIDFDVPTEWEWNEVRNL